MIEHIRLSSSDFVKKSKVVINDLKNIINDNRLEDHIGYGIDIKNDSNLNFDDVDELTDNDLKKIISLIGIRNDSMTRHDQANIWGPYRLIKQISMLDNNDNYDQLVDQYESHLAESLFFKKILIQESRADGYQIPDNDRTTFNARLKKLRKSISKVAIIDDEIDKWGDAYKTLFNGINIDCYDGQTNSFNPEKTSKYNLIILDLRLKEKAQNNESDQLNIEKLSGMLVLDKLKKADPTVPVIMCTASNKAWSHDAAISKGADGFWTKESPTVSIGMDYSFHNTFDLINVCTSVMEWSKKVKPIFSKMKSIRVKIKRINHSIADSINLKYNLIASNLLREPNKFFEKEFENSLVFPFLTVWSIGNDILSLVTEEEEENGIEYIMCDFKNQTIIMFYKQENKYIIDQDLKKLIGGARIDFRYDEKVIMKFLLFKTFGNHYAEKRKELEHFRKIRNHTDIIHGYTQSKNRVNSSEIKFSDLYDLLSIYHTIIMNIK